jgi:hypothetical protein
LKQIKDLKQRTIWDLIYASDDAKILLSKWVFDQKFDENGNWIRNRARWVVCGNFQGTNDWAAQNLYAAVASAVAVKIFFILVAVLGMNSIQLDIVTAFLNATAKSKILIYVFQPTGFSDGIKRVCKLNRAFYGLRESPIWWYETICPYLQTMGFESMLAD